MHSVDEALNDVLARTQVLATEEVSPNLGRVLAEDIQSDIDSPPFDKSMMDGIAVRSQDTQPGAVLAIIDEVTAGRVSQKSINRNQAIRIMTGAPIPKGADAVIMIEQCKFDGDQVTIAANAQVGQHVQPRAKEMRAGEMVLSRGSAIRAVELGLLAAIGTTKVLTYRLPDVAIVPTGDELVNSSMRPAAGQIRNSNGPMLAGQVKQIGSQSHVLHIARDNREDLCAKLSLAMKCHAVILSGGVSAGKLDLVPSVLAELGVESHVHKVFMKPGKPLYFGTRGKTMIFGLPGNPISSFVGFELFVAPALRKMMGVRDPEPKWIKLPLAESIAQSDRPTYHPSKIDAAEIGEKVRPLPWQGSADLRGLCRADSLALVPEGSGRLEAGTPVSVLRLPA